VCAAVTLLWLGLSGAGCTISHDIAPEADASVADGGRSGGAAGRAAAGRGGTGAAGRGGTGAAGRAAAGRGGTGAAGRGTAGAAASCGTCPAPAVLAGIIGAVSCCTSDGSCGLSFAALGIVDCLALGAEGEADPSCPMVTLGGMIMLDGCCSPSGACGAFDTYLGLGCAQIPGAAITACDP
jgi:hypothetical protein